MLGEKYLTDKELSRLFQSRASEDPQIPRQLERAVYIGEREGADMKVLLTAILLQNIGSSPRESARAALPFLKNIEYDKKSQVLHCILAGSQPEKPQTKEASIVQDCNSLALFELSRVVERQNTQEQALALLEQARQRLSNLSFFTKAAKELEGGRTAKLIEFLETYKKEKEGAFL